MFEKSVISKSLIEFPFSKGFYYITVKGDVLREDGDKLPVTLSKDSQPGVFAELWNGGGFYLIADLMAIVFKNVQLPTSHWKEVEGFYIDGDVNNRHASNIGYRFRTHPLPSEKYPNYFHVPFFTQYVMNKKGELIKGDLHITDTWRTTSPGIMNPKNIRGGYKVRQLTNDIGVRTSIGRHRLMCLTFKPYPDNVDRLDVNHNNGVPGDDWVDNLDWMTRSRNLSHAYETGLRTQNKHVLIRDVLTGEVSEHWSISEGARSLGLACDEALRFRLNARFGSVFQDGTQVKLKDDKRDWVTPKDPKAAVLDAQERKGVKVLNCRTMEETEFESISMCERELDIPLGVVKTRLRLNRKGVHRGYQFKYLDDDSPWEPFTEDDVEGLGSIARPVKARHLKTGEERSFNSVKNCVFRQKIKGTLSSQLRGGKQPVYPDGWQYAYANEEWRAVDDVDGAINAHNTLVRARNVLTGEEFTSDSQLGLAKLLGVNSNAVGMAIKSQGHKIHHGFQFAREADLKEWPTFSDLDIQCLRIGHPFNGIYDLLENVETGEGHIFTSSQSIVDFLETINSKPVYHRVKRSGELLDGKYRYKVYQPKWWLATGSQTTHT